jgi:hypothetical protein
MDEIVEAVGHPNVSATHGSTFEVTTDDYLTPAGDCILGIEADRAPADFDRQFVDRCRDEEATVEISLHVEGHESTIQGHGSPALSFASEQSLVCRTSSYVDDRTVMCGADAAAADIDRELIEELQAGSPLRVRLSVR